MKIFRLSQTFGIYALNKLNKATDASFNGALACLESFYYAFNNKDIKVLKEVWHEDDLSQLNNPLGGIVYGVGPIVELYDKVFKSKASVHVEFGSIICYDTLRTVVFAGIETGEFKNNKNTIPLRIRTTRFLAFINEKQRWFQLHHHGSIDDAKLLDQYQQAVKSTTL